jgi:hypothetical protein
MVLGPELFLLSLCAFGWRFALALQVLLLVSVFLTAPAAASSSSGARSLLGHFLERLDAATPWAFAGVAAATVLGASLPADALAPHGSFGSIALVSFLSIGLPIHAALAPLLGAALAGKGLWALAALVLCCIGPLLAQPRSLGLLVPALAVVLGAALLFANRQPLQPLVIDERVSWCALAILVALVVRRIYRSGFRAWLAPLGPEEHPAHAHAAGGEVVRKEG